MSSLRSKSLSIGFFGFFTCGLLLFTGCTNSEFAATNSDKDGSDNQIDSDADQSKNDNLNQEGLDPTTGSIDTFSADQERVLKKSFADFLLTGQPGQAHKLPGCSADNLASCNFTCPSGYEVRGGIGDCGIMSPPFADTTKFTCFGNRQYCRKLPSPTATDVVTNVTLATDTSCPFGTSMSGSFLNVNRDNPSDRHSYSICIEKQSRQKLRLNDKIVTEVKFTASGLRTPAGESCPVGFDVVATFLDCGNSTNDSHTYRDCSGAQRLCIKREKL